MYSVQVLWYYLSRLLRSPAPFQGEYRIPANGEAGLSAISSNSLTHHFSFRTLQELTFRFCDSRDLLLTHDTDVSFLKLVKSTYCSDTMILKKHHQEEMGAPTE